MSACNCCERPPCDAPHLEYSLQTREYVSQTVEGDWSGGFVQTTGLGFDGSRTYSWSGSYTITFIKNPSTGVTVLSATGTHVFTRVTTFDSGAPTQTYEITWTLDELGSPVFGFEWSEAVTMEDPVGCSSGAPSNAFPRAYQGGFLPGSPSNVTFIVSGEVTVFSGTVPADIVRTITFDQVKNFGTADVVGSGSQVTTWTDIEVTQDYTAYSTTPASASFSEDFGSPLAQVNQGLLQFKDLRWRMRHNTPGTCAYKVWLNETDTPDGGSPTVTPLTPYEWSGSGNPCLVDPASRYDTGTNVITGDANDVAAPTDPGTISIDIEKYSCLADYEPDITDPGNPQPNGYPDPAWVA